jgi:hypothetical protein
MKLAAVSEINFAVNFMINAGRRPGAGGNGPGAAGSGRERAGNGPGAAGGPGATLASERAETR